MPLANAKDLLMDAEKGGYAVGAFNCSNMEILQAIVSAAEEMAAPVIVQASQGAVKYAGLEYIAAMVKTAAEMASVPIAVHLDHGTSFEQVIKCIRLGFTSVMFDGSMLPFDENVVKTAEVVKAARAVGVSVEGELGRIGGAEDDVTLGYEKEFFTDPHEAAIFVEKTGVDFLAVAVGTVHGKYKGVPNINFELLAEINRKVGIPLVLHGSSGLPGEDIKKAVSLGVRKVNIDTDLREAFVEGIREALQKHPEEIDPRKILGPAREKVKEAVEEKINYLGCAGTV
ncbi:MAG: Fructose-1,6-bisphosphate aldolase, class II [Clostridia bacterium 41_269]|nr:MAG: Fructose-1,6-bisphosphate aldolase, class II [Clostridia bacterium 41_269]